MTWTQNLATLMPNGMWPLLDQNTAVALDGGPNNNAPRNCGETVICEMARFLADMQYDPDYVKDVMLGGNATGDANEHQIAAFLHSAMGTPCTVYYPQDMGTAMAIVRHYLLDVRPLIVLRRFSSPTDTAGHWNAVFGGDGQDAWHTNHIFTADPWTGTARVETNSTFYEWMLPYPTAGQRCLIGIDRYRSVYTTGGAR